jgi:glutamate/aspartate transport system permease protein
VDFDIVSLFSMSSVLRARQACEDAIAEWRGDETKKAHPIPRNTSDWGLVIAARLEHLLYCTGRDHIEVFLDASMGRPGWHAHSSKALVFIGNAWTELFRNIPLLVQVFLWYYVIPELVPPLKQVPSLVLVVFALGFFTSARVAEQVKAGIQALPKGQRHAGLAMGLTLPQTYRYVLLPMAFRIVIPPLTSEAMNIVKNSSVAFVISVSELTMFALQAGEETSRNIEIYIAVTALYFVSAFIINRIALFIEKRVQVPGMMGAR